MASSQDLETETMKKSDHLETKSSLLSCSRCGKMLANRSNVHRHEKICQSNIQVSPDKKIYQSNIQVSPDKICQSNIQVSPPIVDVIYEQAEEIKREVIDNKTKRCHEMNTEIIPRKDNLVKQREVNVEPPAKRGRRVFISTEEFNRLVNISTVKWLDLSRDCIYKLEKIHYDINQQPLVNLSNSDGVTISTVTPAVVMKKLLPLSETDVIIYLRLNGKDAQVDIATVKKYVCTACKISFHSRMGLWNHQRKYCVEKKKIEKSEYR